MAASLGASDRRALVRDLARRGALEITCAGRSMEPTLRPGDRVQVTRAARPRAGDVVLLESADRRDLILHRVVAALPGLPWFFHAGDAPAPEGPALAHRDQIIGVADLPRRLPGLRDGIGIARRAAQRALRTGWLRRGLL